MKKLISAILCLVTLLSLSAISFAEDDLNWLTPPSALYEDVEYFEKNVYVFTLEGKKGLIDSEGKILINATYKDFVRCTCGNVYTDEGRRNIITLYQGYTRKSVGRETVHPLCFGFYAYLGNGVKHVAVGDKTMAHPVGAKDRPLVFEKVTMSADRENGGYKFSTLKRSGIYGYITADGTQVFDGTLTGAVGFSDGIGAVQKDGKWAYISENGEYLTDFMYSDTKKATHLIDKDGVYLLSEGLIPVCRDGRWGYIDKSGREVVRCMYEKTTPVFGGKAWVKYNGKWGIADMSKVPVIAEKVTLTGFLSNSGQYAGESARIGYTAEPPSSKIYWASGDEEVLTVGADGTVSFKAPGDAAVNACDASGKILASLPVTVTEKPKGDSGPLMSTESKNLTAFVFTLIFGLLALGCIVLMVITVVLKKKKESKPETEKTEEKE